MANNKLFLAAAGSGKTTFLVNEALKITDKKVLITTYTEANEDEIRKKFIERNGCVPGNITIQTWFSFLLQHGVRPFQSVMESSLDKIDIGFILVDQQSGFRFKNHNGAPIYWGETDTLKYYFGKGKIFSDKISRFVYESNDKSGNAVISRIEKIFDYIFIDEVQDLAGWDLELLKLLFQSSATIFLAGDPRQVTYLTHHSSKHQKYSDGKIQEFLSNECKKILFEIDASTLGKSHRNCDIICTYSSKLFPEFDSSSPCECDGCIEKRFDILDHFGIFLIKPEDADQYIKTYNPTILRDKESVYPEWNFGKSKGLTFDRVIIHPTEPMISWIRDHESDLKPASRSKFYVALTRARKSVGIVFPLRTNESINDVEIYNPSK